MSEYKTSDGYTRLYLTKDVTITSGNSLSSAIDLEQLNIVGFLLPASWTSAKLTFQVSPDGTTYGDLQDSSGNEIQLTVAAGKFVGVNLPELSGSRFVKVRSGVSGSAVNQAADRTISLILTTNAEAGGASTSTTPSSSPSVFGGGGNTYSNLQGDFVATANNGAKTITLSSYASSILSTVLTAKHFATAIIKKVDTNGVVTTLPTTTVAFASNVLTLSDMTANFASGDTVVVSVQGPEKGYDTTNDQRKMTLNSALSKSYDSVEARIEGGTPVAMSASGVVLAAPGRLRGIFVSAASSTPTIKLWNNASAGSGTVLVDTFTPVAGMSCDPKTGQVPMRGSRGFAWASTQATLNA